ncbi:MAG: NADH-quinone oxidoreductase subunit L, partial [Candidatus Omnitrophica bacterium]|nr:NADH-quinone oxidoreductase subunit L [Candidatus Omnitrophota bacterium]
MSALLLIPGVPLITAALLLLFGRRIGKASAWLTVLALASTFFMTIALSDLVFAGNRIGFSWVWLSQASANWTLGLSVDGLGWVMLVVVTSIGLCSYLLISFWFEKSAAAEAGRKAFLTTRIGDTGMLLGILILFWSSGSLQLGNLAQVRQTLDPHVLTLISALLFFGAIGKSAQVPLHIWLPDAMEGPTPVSALIHAATMVAAGVYLVARTFPLFTPESLTLVLGIGLITHLFAATIALTMTDIKRVLAYSTISQLGLMMTALGLKAMPLALFHLCMHAFCKALLFLGAGSVIHGTHQQELEHLRGLRHFMPLTWITFLIAMPWVFWSLVLGALLTATYLLRLYLRCFHGSPSSDAKHAHESPAIMTVPLILLAIFAAGIGLVGSPWMHHVFFRIIGVHEMHEGIEIGMVALSAALVLGGFWLAWQVGFRRRQLLPASLRPIGQWLYQAAFHKYYVDEFYGKAILQPFYAATRAFSRFDQKVVDGAVNAAGSGTWRLGQWKERVD